MKVISGKPMGRFELAEKGIQFDEIEEGIDRVWVYSLLYKHKHLKAMQTDKWKLVVLRKREMTYSFALFCRVDSENPTNVTLANNK